MERSSVYPTAWGRGKSFIYGSENSAGWWL